MENTVEEQEVDNIETEEVESEAVEEVETDEPQEEDEETEDTEEEGEVVYSFGEDSPPQEEELNEEVPKKLRQEIRDRNKRIKELEAELGKTKPKEEMPTLGAKPTLESCDYDESEYESKLDSWYVEKRKHDEKQAEIEAEQKEAEKAWENTLNNYTEKREAINRDDFEDAELVVMESLSETQQGMILQGAKNPAALVYALGKNPSKAKELSEIKDPVKFAWAASQLEGAMKTTRRKPQTKPEKTVIGTGSLSGTTDKQLEKLRAEAAKTGDYSKVRAYKSKLRG